MVNVFLDFDSTITEESTLMQLYLRLPESVLKEAVRISNEEYYQYEEQQVMECYRRLHAFVQQSRSWDACVRLVTGELLEHSKRIAELERRGMDLVEKPLASLDVEGLQRAASQITVRQGFQDFLSKFDKQARFVLSFNWSDELIRLVCREIPAQNIIANRLKFQRGKCTGFDRRVVFLTPEDKLRSFLRLKGKVNVVCGDSLPDLLPCLHANIAFGFVSHDQEFLALLREMQEKFDRPFYSVKDFNDAGTKLQEKGRQFYL